MGFRIAKEFRFSAAHQLDYLPSDHKCHRLHGHNYIVTLELEADELDERGFAGADYGELKNFAKVIECHDHRNLNDYYTAQFTTAENLAKRFFEMARDMGLKVCSVRVCETPSTYAEYRA